MNSIQHSPAFSVGGMHELIGAPVEKTPDGRPIYNMEQDRINAINWGADALFQIADNPSADDSSPVWEIASLGNGAVNEHYHLVSEISAKHGVDADLVRAIMWTEAARGHKFGINDLGDALGTSGSIMPMNIQPDKWAGLVAGTRKDLEQPEKNIEAAVILIKRLTERVNDPTPEKIGTLWNSLAKETVTDLGAYNGRIYLDKPWRPKSTQKKTAPAKSEQPREKPALPRTTAESRKEPDAERMANKTTVSIDGPPQ